MQIVDQSFPFIVLPGWAVMECWQHPLLSCEAFPRKTTQLGACLSPNFDLSE